MPNSPLSLAMPRRLSVSIKLGGLFLVLATLTTGNLVFSNVLHGSIENIAGLINQSGKLRYHSQKIAFNSAGFALEPSMAARAAGLEGEAEFEVLYVSVVHDVKQLHPLMRSAGDGLDAHLQQIDQTWQRQHVALARVLAEPALTARLSAQREVAILAQQLLGQTDDLVNTLEKTERSARQRADFIIYLVLALEALLMFGTFFYVRSRVTLPIINLIEFTRRFAIGKQAVRED
ncbi:MAG: type IV pili methyl-accepting chemotaxis transducer N-terminal domain-containing protein [Thiobacillus sp.]|nr:type IV pili methyl-accepting chemotaxis transducer N-terminal domain-containing protein [Thiobacillus sp.]